MARPIAQDYSLKRDHILKTAARVFAQTGYARASMSLVAKDCGISKANIYHYYDSKDALLFDILDTYLCALRDRLQALPLAGQAPPDQFRMFVVDILLAYKGMDNEHRIQTEGIPLLDPKQRAVLKGYQRDMVDQLGTIIIAIAPKVFADDAPKVRATVMSVFGMLNWFYMWNRGADDAARMEYGDHIARMTLGGISTL